MQFTRLRLNGFKSFVDPTDLVIAEGLTGVVGPNGCGKSNLLEALRWVMGETRPSAMRGGGMEDVIFAGARSRGPRQFAEVTLQIDNSDRRAPPALNESDRVEIIRRITREAGSAYRANGREVRARDVHMLFADAATGAQSSALVRQGQIAELINAKPKGRRRVLEEAAGIGGLYQRRHEAELKLKATESNLERVEDVIDQLAQQLVQLTRQAKQAARYRAIGADLRLAEGRLLYRRWQDAEAELLAARMALTTRLTGAARAEAAARAAASARDTAEEALPPLREEHVVAAAVLQRAVMEQGAQASREAAAAEEIARLEARTAELTAEAEREAQLDADAQRMERQLTQEVARLRQDGAGHGEAVAQAEAAADAASTQLATLEAQMQAATEAAAEAAAAHRSADRQVADAEAHARREQAQATHAEAALAEAQAAVTDGARAVEDAARTAEAAEMAQHAAERELAAAETARATAQSDEAVCRAAASAAAGTAKALQAEVDGLRRLLAKAQGGAEQLLDHLQVRPGYERALGAALADDLRAPPITPAARSGWAVVPPYDTSSPLPAGAEPLAPQVDGTPHLARRLAFVGVVAAADGARLQPALLPGQRLVSREGDLWRWDGFVAAAADAPSAAALRLEQENRLKALTVELEAAAADLAATEAAHRTATETLRTTTAAEKSARQARAQADAALTASTRARTQAETARDRAANKAEVLTQAVTRHRDAAETAETALNAAQSAQAALAPIDGVQARLAAAKTAVEAARIATVSRRAALEEIVRVGAARARRLERMEKDRADWARRATAAADRQTDLAARREAAQSALAAARAVPDTLVADAERIAAAVTAAERRKTAAAEAVAAADRALRQAAEAERTAERTASEAREDRARAEAVVSAAQDRAEAATARIAEALDRSPEVLAVELGEAAQDLPDTDTLEALVTRLRRSRDALGAVNLRAEDDAREVQTEHDALTQEKRDLEAAIAKLRGAIGSLNKEGRERLQCAFESVNDNFRTLFTHLFSGGEANLVLVESDDPLDAGLEIMCQPPGKTLSTLSLLSGGEQTLTALALIFAVFLANPAPICVLDEVDAPLDDANVTRFCDLMDEMSRRTHTRFLVITHHAVTMSRMDRLFGVTMAEPGVSQLVSVDLKRAAALVA